MMDMTGNPELISSTPIILASTSTAPYVGFGVMLIVAMVSIDIGINNADILNAVFFDAVPDLFDNDIPQHLQEGLEALYDDDVEWPSTPDIADNLSTTPGQVDTLINTISHQLNNYLVNYFRVYTEPLLENAAIQIRSGNFNLDPNSYEYRALEQLSRNLVHHEENFHYLAGRLQDVINRIEPGSQLWENHPELHSNFRGLNGIAGYWVVELNNLRWRSRRFRWQIRDKVAQLLNRRP